VLIPPQTNKKENEMIQKRAKRKTSRARQVEEFGDLWKSQIAASMCPEDQMILREAYILESSDKPWLPVHFSAAERFHDAFESSRKSDQRCRIPEHDFYVQVKIRND
jgi:hypothetical protein